MSIVATFVGGPRDGEQIALADPNQTLRVSIPVRPSYTPEPLDYMSVGYQVLDIRPELTRTGWVLRWREL